MQNVNFKTIKYDHKRKRIHYIHTETKYVRGSITNVIISSYAKISNVSIIFLVVAETQITDNNWLLLIDFRLSML